MWHKQNISWGRTHKILLPGVDIDMVMPLIPSSDNKILPRSSLSSHIPAFHFSGSDLQMLRVISPFQASAELCPHISELFLSLIQLYLDINKWDEHEKMVNWDVLFERLLEPSTGLWASGESCDSRVELRRSKQLFHCVFLHLGRVGMLNIECLGRNKRLKGKLRLQFIL